MFIYLITFSSGVKKQIRANSPKQADEIASKEGTVSHIKFLRGKVN